MKTLNLINLTEHDHTALININFTKYCSDGRPATGYDLKTYASPLRYNVFKYPVYNLYAQLCVRRCRRSADIVICKRWMVREEDANEAET